MLEVERLMGGIHQLSGTELLCLPQMVEVGFTGIIMEETVVLAEAEEGLREEAEILEELTEDMAGEQMEALAKALQQGHSVKHQEPCMQEEVVEVLEPVVQEALEVLGEAAQEEERITMVPMPQQILEAEEAEEGGLVMEQRKELEVLEVLE